MRTVDMTGLTGLGPDGVGPWRLGEDRLLRTARLREPLRTLELAQHVFDTYRAAHDSGARTPAPIEIVRVGEGYGVVVEYVVGLALSTHILLGSYGLEEAALEVGRLQRALHGGRMCGGADVKARFLGLAREVVKLMDPQTGERIVALVEGVPKSDAFLHGDLHLGNVVVSGGELRLIDMELAGFGDPVFDLAVSRSRIINNAPREAARLGIPPEQAAEYAERLWRAQLEGYLGDADAALVEEADRQTRLLAQLEFLGFASHSFDAAETGDPSQREPLARELGHLAALVSEVGSLGLG